MTLCRRIQQNIIWQFSGLQSVNTHVQYILLITECWGFIKYNNSYSCMVYFALLGCFVFFICSQKKKKTSISDFSLYFSSICFYKSKNNYKRKKCFFLIIREKTLSHLLSRLSTFCFPGGPLLGYCIDVFRGKDLSCINQHPLTTFTQ